MPGPWGPWRSRKVGGSTLRGLVAAAPGAGSGAAAPRFGEASSPVSSPGFEYELAPRSPSAKTLRTAKQGP